jgi:hypothetical protein
MTKLLRALGERTNLHYTIKLKQNAYRKISGGKMQKLILFSLALGTLVYLYQTGNF